MKMSYEQFVSDFGKEAGMGLKDRRYLTAHAYCAVIGQSGHAGQLDGCPHEELENLAVIAKCRIGENVRAVITHDICCAAGLTSEELLRAAHANTDEQEAVLKTMGEVLADAVGAFQADGKTDGYFPDEQENIHPPIYILTNRDALDGAAMIVKSGMLAQASRKIAADLGCAEPMSLYILPSSRHEVLLVPALPEYDPDELRTIVMDVNSSIVEPEDRLSDSIYRFDSGRFSVVNPLRQKTKDI